MSTAASSHQPKLSAPNPSRRFSNLMIGLSLGGHLVGLSGRGTQVLLAIAVRFNWKRGAAWPSIPDLAARTGLSADTIQRGIKDLEAAGLVVPVKVAGKVTRYVWPGWVSELATRDPWSTTEGNQPQGCGHLSKQPAAGLRPKHLEDLSEPLEEHQQAASAAGGDVVDLGELPEEKDQHQAMVAPVAMLPRDLYQALRALGVRAPSKLAHHGEARLRYVLAMATSRKGIKNPAGWLVTALAQGWTDPKQEAQASQHEREAVIAQAAPPPGTRWAQAAGHVVQVLEVSADRVMTSTGVIPRSNWPMWVWLDRNPAEPSAQEPQEGASNEAGGVQDLAENVKGASAARAVLAIAVKKPGTMGQLEAVLTRYGVTLDEVKAQAQADGITLTLPRS